MSNFYQGKKVLVTGASGLTGAYVVQTLLAEGSFVRAVEHVTPLVNKDNSSRLEIFKGGLCNVDSCQQAVKDIEFVFHCAAVTSGAYDIVNTPAKHITPNLIMCSRLLECAAAEGIKRFLFMSSSTVYPNSTAAMKEDDAWTGDVHPSYQAVGWMKRYVEKMCEFYNDRTPMKVCIVRPANIYGPGDKFDLKTAHVLPALIHKIVRGDNPLEVWGTGYDMREFIFVQDLVNGLLLAMKRYCCGKPINLGSGECVSISDSVSAICDICGYKGKIVYNASKPSTIPIRRLDSSLARAVLGFATSTDFREGLYYTISWFKENCKELLTNEASK
jgi:GDP-L-fucose synthase